MFERNAMATIDAIAGERGERYLLAADPSSKDGSVKGYHKPPNTKIDEKLNTLIENHINKYDVPFIRFYQEFDKIHDSKANLDLMDAIKSCEYYYSFFTRIGDEKDKDIIRKKIITVDQQGNTQTKWIKIGYNDRIS